MEQFLVKFQYPKTNSDCTGGHSIFDKLREFSFLRIFAFFAWHVTIKVLYIEYSITVQFVLDFGIS